jgi:hypothetical protein
MRGDEPPAEPRAEIIDVTGDPQAWSDPSAAGGQRSAGPGAQVGSGRPVGPIGRRSSRAVIAGAGLVVILGVAVVVAFNTLGDPRPAVLPKSASVPRLTGFPGTAGGLSVVSISTATATAADASIGAGELAVGGWYTAVRLVESCRPSLQPIGTCVSDWSSVLESRPDTVWSADPGGHPHEAGTDSINPTFIDPIGPPTFESLNPGGPLEVIPPSPVVLIGHFHDGRLPVGSAFVVDAVADLTGTVSTSPGSSAVATTQLTAQAVVTEIRSHLQPAGFVLGFGPVQWAVDASVVPVVESSADGPPADGRTVWLVRGYLGSPPGSAVGSTGRVVASWMGIDDATGQVWGPLATMTVPGPPTAAFPATIEDLTVQSVGQALAAARTGQGLVAIGGYLSNDRAPEGCPPAPTTGKPNPCSDTRLALIDQAGSILQPNDATFLYDLASPAGLPSITPLILAGISAPDPWAGLSGLAARVGPRRVVLIGEFGDPRSPQCAPRPGGGNAGCDLSFVVDQIAWIEDVPQGPSILIDHGIATGHTAAQILAVARNWLPPGSATSIVAITAASAGHSAGLTGYRLAGPVTGIIWIVRLAGGLSSSLSGGGYLVVEDQTAAVVEQAWLVLPSP